jgi:hypothetical protein
MGSRELFQVDCHDWAGDRQSAEDRYVVLYYSIESGLGALSRRDDTTISRPPRLHGHMVGILHQTNDLVDMQWA